MVASQQRTSILKKTFFDESLKRYCINFLEHGSFYNFYNSREVVSKFLTMFENNFIPNADLRQSKFKCSFAIVNWQPAPRDGFAEITDSRIWQTNVYDGIYLNVFIKSDLNNDILKTVIMNSMSGSSWKLKRFDRSDLRSIGKWKFFDVMEFIEKYARVYGSDDEMEDDADGDEVNEFDSEFIDDETNFQD